MTPDTPLSLRYLGVCFYAKYLPSPVMLLFPEFQVFQEFSGLLPFGWFFFAFCDWKKPQKHSQRLIRFDLTLLSCPLKD